MIKYEKMYGIQAKLELTGDSKNFNHSLSIPIFRIIQEGMTNVAKHASSTMCKVSLGFLRDRLDAKIIDDGIGFSPDDFWKDPGEHFGLVGMRERVEMYSGQLSILSSAGNGTQYSFVIPYHSKGGREND